MVDKVKRSESGMIQNPITIDQNASIFDAQKIMSEYRISGLPVVKDEKLIGIITNRDIRFETDGVTSCLSTNDIKKLSYCSGWYFIE